MSVKRDFEGRHGRTPVIIEGRGAADCGEYRQAAGSCGRSSARPATRMGTEDPIHGQAFHSKRPLHVLHRGSNLRFLVNLRVLPGGGKAAEN